MNIRKFMKKTVCAVAAVSVMMSGTAVYAEETGENPLDVLNNRGFSTHFMTTNTKKDLEMLKNAGIKNIRDELGWSVIEHTKGVYSFDGFGTTYPINAKQAGTEVLLCMDYWHDLYVSGAIDTDEEREGFANYCKAVARQYPQINKFEIYNEPNLWFDWNWHNDPTDYVKLLETASKAIKSVNPNAAIIGGAFADYQGIEPYFAKFYAMEGVYPSADAISIHPYWYYNGTPQSVYESRLRLHSGYLSSLGGFKDLYVTELGFPTVSTASGTGNSDTPSRTQEQQAADLIKSYAIGDYYNVAEFYLYDFKDDGTDPNNNEHNFGIITNGGAPKKAYYAVKEMNKRISGAPYMGTLVQKTAGATASEEIHVYNVDGTPVALAWYNRDSNSSATKYHRFDNSVSVYDIYGNLTTQGKYIKLTSEPVYIYGLSKSAMYDAARDRAKQYIDSAISEAGGLSGASAESIKTALNEASDMMKNSIETAAKANTVYRKTADCGNEIAESYVNGSITAQEKKIGTLLDYMSNAAENILKIYAAAQTSADKYSIESGGTISACADKVAKYGGDVAKAILKRAKKYNGNAVKLSGTQGLATEYGMTAAYDMLAADLAKWADKLIPEKEEEPVSNIAVSGKFDGNGYLTITGKAPEGTATVAMYVLKPSANGVLSPVGLDCIDQIRCAPDGSFTKKYLTCGEYGSYTIVVSSRNEENKQTAQADFYTADNILSLAKRLKEAGSAAESANIMTSASSDGTMPSEVLSGYSLVFAKVTAEDITAAQFGEYIYGRKSEINTESETEFAMFADKIALMCAINAADTAGMKKVIEKYSPELGFDTLNAYKTYSEAAESLQTIICERLAQQNHNEASEWRSAFSSVVILSAIERSNVEKMYDIIETNNDKLNISFEKYNALSNENKYLAMKYFCRINIYFGQRYGSFEEAKSAFDKAVAIYGDSQLESADEKIVYNGRIYTDEAYTFKLAGDSDKTFVMLDEDKDGDMFVITKDTYGMKKACDAQNPDYSVITENGVKKINYGDENQMLHWLTNGFVTDGYEYNGTVYKLPQGIADNLKTAQWQFEPLTMSGGQQIPQEEMTAKVSLLGVTEFQKYKDILGYDDGIGAEADGWHVRTLLNGSNTDSRAYVSAKLETAWKFAEEKEYAIRPCFYLKKDFLLTEKIDVASMGGKVKRYIRESYGRSELAQLYSESELDEIYGSSETGTLKLSFKNGNNEEITSVLNEKEIKGVYAVENNTDYAIYATPIIASYNKTTGALADIKIPVNPVMIPPGASAEAETPLMKIKNAENTEIRCFLWSDGTEPYALCGKIG